MGDGDDERLRGMLPAGPLPTLRLPPRLLSASAAAAPAVGPDTAGDSDLDTPNCPDCLMRMEAEEAPDGHPYWACTECGLVALA